MATLSAWKFDQADGASHVVRTLKELQDEGLITIQDAAIVEWPVGKKKPKTRQLNDLVGPAALGGAFWGLLFGLLFFAPLIGAAVGAAGGALVGSLRDVGIDDAFIKKTKSAVTEGTSALFLLSSSGVEDRIRQRFVGTHAELISTNLTGEDEQKLREVFAED
ncbi:MAG: hypothetical protein QOF52_3296 [Propionibacteriaceae bacterium]|nr:hypothetical protein [Propionibacteriaceae bacterium]